MTEVEVKNKQIFVICYLQMKSFLNKHRNLIKSRLDKDIQLKDIAKKELGVSIDYVTKTIIKQDEKRVIKGFGR